MEESDEPAASSQQPATSNQQPATSNQQPATSNQQLILRTLLAAVTVMVSNVCYAATPRFLVVHDPSDPDQVEDIDAAIDAAQAVNGVVEFEAGKVYRTSEVQLWRDSGSTDSGNLMVAGIEGNGAMLKWPTDVVPDSGKALLYLWAPQYKANSGCYIRNLTLDCGNNDIPTAATAGDTGAGLEGTGGTGQLIGTDEACDYGLRIYGGEDFLVENVTVLRAATTGVYVQTNSSYTNENGSGSLDGWAAGFHLLGGHVRDRYNREPDDGVIDYDDMNAPDGLIQSMVHSKNQSSLDTSLRASLTEGVADNDVVRGNSIPAEGGGS